MMLNNDNLAWERMKAVKFQFNTQLSLKETPKDRTEVYQASFTNFIQFFD